MISKLTQYLDNDIHDLQSILKESGYTIAHGDTYSLQEVRKAVCRDKLPVYAKLESGNTVLFVGENKANQLVIQDKDGNLFNSDDLTLKKAWTGEVVIVTDYKPLMKAMEYNKEPVDIVLWNHSMNSWDDNQNKDSQYISDIKYVDECYLPEHPVIVYFKKPDEKELKEKVRSYTKGVEICIIDPSDPYTEFLHELGHVYWSSRLNKEEKESIKELHSKLDKDHLPPILTDNWSWMDEQELFATLYMFYLKGVQRNTGYLKILEITYNTGYNLMTSIFERVKKDITVKQLIDKRKQEIENNWKENEKNIGIFLNQSMGKAVKIKVGDQIIKAKNLPYKDIFENVVLPDSIKTKVLSSYKGREWHYVDSGLLKGKVIVTDNNENIDFDYIETHKKYYLVPVERLIKAGDKSYKTVSYVTPETVLKEFDFVPNNKPVKQSLIEKIKHTLKSFSWD